MSLNQKKGAGPTGPRTPNGKRRSSQNARKHALSAQKLTPVEYELVGVLADGICKEFCLNGTLASAIGYDLAQNEIYRKRVEGYAAHQFKIADANAEVQNGDRMLRKQFEANFRPDIAGAGRQEDVVPRLPATTAAIFLSKLKKSIELPGPNAEEDLDRLHWIYGSEMDMVGGAISFHYWSFNHHKNDHNAEQYRSRVLEAIELAIKIEQGRSIQQGVAELVEFNPDAPVLPNDEIIDRIHRHRSTYERRRSRLLGDLKMIQDLKRK
jgi:hypothetical protein